MAQNNGPGLSGPSVTNGAGSREERVGETIKRERERRQISIDVVAKTLKLNARYIEALEANEYDQLPGDTYVRVYLRSLSHFLSLDSEEIFRRFFEERGLTGADTLRKDSSTKINLKAQEEKKNNTPIVAIFSVIALLAVFSFLVNRQGCRASPAVKTPRAAVAADARQTDTVHSLTKPAAATQTFSRDTKKVEFKPAEKRAGDTVIKPAAGAALITKEISVPDVKPSAAADTAGKKVTSSGVSIKKDTVKPAGRTNDTLQTNRKVPESPDKTESAPVRTKTDTGSMVLRMTVVGDSCWGRVISDGGKDWKNLLLNGKGVSFTARDSFNVHIGAGDAVAFTLNGKPLEFPKKKGVMTFKVDRSVDLSSAVTVWTLEKWNSVFEKRQ